MDNTTANINIVIESKSAGGLLSSEK